jgi:hypothetical protein
MIRRSISIPVKVTWRMSVPDPVEVDIDLTEPNPGAVLLGLPDSGWLESSRDLFHGLQVRESPTDTLPVELVEAFTGAKR